jgi:hypothetical protein
MEESGDPREAQQRAGKEESPFKYERIESLFLSLSLPFKDFIESRLRNRHGHLQIDSKSRIMFPKVRLGEILQIRSLRPYIRLCGLIPQILLKSLFLLS